MALTLTEVKGAEAVNGKFRERVYDVTFDTSYTDYVLAAKDVGFGTDIFGLIDVGGNTAGAAYRADWNVSAGRLELRGGGSGATTYTPGGGDLLGATNPAGTEGNADQAAAPVNSAALLAADTFTNFAGTMTPTANPDVPRNVVITIENDSGGPLNLFEGVTTFLITGTRNGIAQTESVTLTSTAGNKAVANTKFRYVQGVKPFSTVTSVAITNAPAGGLKGSLGVGTRLGLPSALATGTYTDVTQITVNAASITPSATTTSAGGVDTTNNAVNTGTTADGNDVSITYNSTGEVATGMDLSAVTRRVRFFGV